eukprot:2409820-Amphidinium_carterae.1
MDVDGFPPSAGELQCTLSPKPPEPKETEIASHSAICVHPQKVGRNSLTLSVVAEQWFCE